MSERTYVVPGVPAPFKLFYRRNSERFRIGQVGNNEISADQAREVVIAEYGNTYNVQSMALAPHDRDKDGVGHNVVCPIHQINGHQTFIGDALMIFDFSKPWLADTFVADCPVLAVLDAKMRAAGFVHCGWPEMAMEEPNIIASFLQEWPAKPNETIVFIGRGIEGQYFERNPTTIPERYQFLCAMPSAWGGTGFSLLCAIITDLRHAKIPIGNIFVDKPDGHPIDTYTATLEGKLDWAASDQLAKRQKLETGQPVYAHRMAACLAYNP